MVFVVREDGVIQQEPNLNANHRPSASNTKSSNQDNSSPSASIRQVKVFGSRDVYPGTVFQASEGEQTHVVPDSHEGFRNNH